MIPRGRTYRANLERKARAVLELRRRRSLTPLAYSKLWHNAPPRTSQRTALLPLLEDRVLMTLLLGGNRTGKSRLLKDWCLAQAAGRDAYVEDGKRGRVYWVRDWLKRNGLPFDLIPNGPGRVWVGSPTFSAAVEQIRPKLKEGAPKGTTFRSWDNKGGEAELRLPACNGKPGGVIVSKAYKQFDNDPQTWEGAKIRAIGLDEQPNSYACLAAAFSRLVDEAGQLLMALTPLRGKADWLYRDLVVKAPAWLRIVHLHGADNPHVPEEHRQLMLAAQKPWQRASRDVGAFGDPEGRIYEFDRVTHVVAPFPIPVEWTRWQGIDWGGRAPHVVWVAESPQAELYVYRELAPRRTTMEPGISDAQLIRWGKDLENGDESLQLCPVYRVADSESPGAITQACEFGVHVVGATKGAGSVSQGITLLEALFATVDGYSLEAIEPRLRVFDTCPVLIEELESYRWADIKEGQKPRPDPACEDHGADGLRYAMQYRQRLGFR